MTAEQIEAIGPEFTGFLRPFENYFGSPHNVRHFRNYIRGLLTDLERKTVEPMALYAGVPPRSLQQFLKACIWDHEGLSDAVRRRHAHGHPYHPGRVHRHRRHHRRNQRKII